MGEVPDIVGPLKLYMGGRYFEPRAALAGMKGDPFPEDDPQFRLDELHPGVRASAPGPAPDRKGFPR
jgi:hypothetical protein